MPILPLHRANGGLDYCIESTPPSSPPLFLQPSCSSHGGRARFHRRGRESPWHLLPSTPLSGCRAKVSRLPRPRSSARLAHGAREAAETFVDRYYQALNSRSDLRSFYVNSSARYPTPADISINGKVVATPADYAALLDAQGPGVRYDVESLDAQVINPSSAYGAPDKVYDEAKVERNGGRMSIVVTAVGTVRFGRDRDAPKSMFNETFVLVPNLDSMAKNPPRDARRWLVMSQNFRAL